MREDWRPLPRGRFPPRLGRSSVPTLAFFLSGLFSLRRRASGGGAVFGGVVGGLFLDLVTVVQPVPAAISTVFSAATGRVRAVVPFWGATVAGGGGRTRLAKWMSAHWAGAWRRGGS